MAAWIAQNYTLIVITVGTMMLGLITGVLGVFLTLKKQALVGDALSHAALPGVVLAFMFTQSKNMLVLIIGAALSATLAMIIIELIKKFSIIKYDASLALILSSFFGFGQVLLLVVQTTGSGASAGLDSFIFGQAATMLISDVRIITLASLLILFIIILFYKEFKLFIFNPEHFQTMGFNKRFTTILLNILVVISVTISIKTVGVILMSALLIAPAVAARQWSDRLFVNLILAGIIGAISASIGVNISASVTNLSTGPVIVVVLTTTVLFAVLFAPKRGIIIKSIKNQKHKRQIKKYSDLIHAYHHDGIVGKSINQELFIQRGYIEQKNEQYFITSLGNKKVKSIIGGDGKWI